MPRTALPSWRAVTEDNPEMNELYCEKIKTLEHQCSSVAFYTVGQVPGNVFLVWKT